MAQTHGVRQVARAFAGIRSSLLILTSLSSATAYLTTVASAQVLEVNGGSSSIYQTQGGSILLHGSAYESEVGAGLIAGRLVAGGHLAYRDKANLYSAGVEEIRFNLPTDLFNSDHRLLGLGIALKSVHPATSLELFAGGTSQRFDTPLFTGVRADQPAAAFILEHAFSPAVQSTTQLLAANPGTALQAVQWKAKPWLTLATAAGVGGSAHYAAVSADLRRPLVDIKISYVDAAAGFHRVGTQSDLSPEPVHENLLFTVRSSRNPHLTLSGGRQNFMVSTNTVRGLSDLISPDRISTSNQISASTYFKAVGLTSTLIESKFDGQSNLALVLSAALSPTQRLRLQSSYFQNRLLGQSLLLSGPTTHQVTNTLVTNVQEVLTHRFGLNQTITYSNGQTSVGYGGSILSNRLTFSADYETFYVPTRPGNPFQQSLVLDIQLNLFGRVTLHGGTFVSPTGRLLHTANIHAIQGRSPLAPQTSEHARFGQYILQGRVIDTDGDPIPGAAISIGPNPIFTDTDGAFFLRDNKSRSYAFKVLADQFLDGHSYRIVSQPAQVSSVKTEDQHLLIIVERVADRPATTDLCSPPVGPQKNHPINDRQSLCENHISSLMRIVSRPSSGDSP